MKVNCLRRPMFWLSLIAALAGTPLRLAETAHDIAVSVADLDGEGAIEVPDGGVGDDSDATIKSPSVVAAVVLAFDDFVPVTVGNDLRLSLHAGRRPADRPPRPVMSGSWRLASLQSFLC